MGARSPADAPHVPISQVRAAVRVLCSGLLERCVYGEQEWDIAVATLALAHDQVGGTTRRLIYDAFSAAHPCAVNDELVTALKALARNLDVSPTESIRSEQLQLPLEQP